MISFYPGPSQTHPELPSFLQEAGTSGILSVNHRSPEFVELSKQTITLLKDRLNVPKNYEVYFTSAATECWEIISQSFLSAYSYHIYNGAFGEKWFNYRKKLGNNADAHAFSPQKMLGLNNLKIPDHTGIICLTQNETSNATQVSQRLIQKVKTRYQKALICVDATSSMAGIELKWKCADIWYASVQKCFGLPAGMAIMVCSPKAIERAKQLNHRAHYNNLVSIHEKMQDWQTTHTPNVLNIFLLNRVMQASDPIKVISNRLKNRQQKLWQQLVRIGLKPLIATTRLRSQTVLAIKTNPEQVAQIKEKAKSAGFLLGNGYGSWKENTFRIANFPAISDAQMDALIHFLQENFAD